MTTGDPIRDAYLTKSRHEERFARTLYGRRPSRRLALLGAKARRERAFAFFMARRAAIVAEAFTTEGPFQGLAPFGEPVEVWATQMMSGGDPIQYWMMANTGDIHPDPRYHAVGIGPLEMASLLEDRKIVPVEDQGFAAYVAFHKDKALRGPEDPH